MKISINLIKPSNPQSKNERGQNTKRLVFLQWGCADLMGYNLSCVCVCIYV